MPLPPEELRADVEYWLETDARSSGKLVSELEEFDIQTLVAAIRAGAEDDEDDLKAAAALINLLPLGQEEMDYLKTLDGEGGSKPEDQPIPTPSPDSNVTPPLSNAPTPPLTPSSPAGP